MRKYCMLNSTFSNTGTFYMPQSQSYINATYVLSRSSNCYTISLHARNHPILKFIRVMVYKHLHPECMILNQSPNIFYHQQVQEFNQQLILSPMQLPGRYVFQPQWSQNLVRTTMLNSNFFPHLFIQLLLVQEILEHNYRQKHIAQIC